MDTFQAKWRANLCRLVIGGVLVAGPQALVQDSVAATGDLDPTFGNGGLVTTTFLGPAGDYAQGVVATCVQADGKMVVAGTTWYNAEASADFALARYNDDGTLDSGFGGDGRVTTDFGSQEDVALSVAVQADGRILVAGYLFQGATGADFALARYNTDGTLDANFGGGGFVTTDFGSYNDVANSVAIQADGRIVVAGYSDQGATGADFALARYNTDGTLDSGFGTGGLVTTDIGFYHYDLVPQDRAYSVAIQADGRIVVAGYSFQAGFFDFALARYNDDGTLDSGFGGDGRVTTNFNDDVGLSAYDDVALSVAVQADGRIVVAGGSVQSQVPGATGADFALARYNTDGTLDSGFGSGGLVTTDFGFYHNNAPGDDWAYSVAVQPDGRIVAAGISQGATGLDFALARYNEDGTLDSGFGSGGLVLTDFGSPYYDVAQSVAIQADGGIVVAGYLDQGGTTGFDFALARYDDTGTLDSGFGSGGVVTTNFLGPIYAVAMDVVAASCQSDGRIIAAGYVSNASGDFALARYNDDGTLDDSFGSGGLVLTDFGSSSDVATSVAVQPDGGIVVAGYSYQGGTTGNDFALARYDDTGTLDSSFGSGGLVTTDFGSYEDFAFSVVVQADGGIVVAGYSYQGGTTDFALARYNEDGTLDSGFDGDGRVTTDLGSYSYDQAYSVAVQPDGGIVVAGYSYQGGTTGNDFALARYDDTGTLDSSFGSGGLVTTDFGSYQDYAYSVAIQSDGGIVVAGYSYQGGTTRDDFSLARYTDTGTLDSGFGGDGLVTTDFGSSDDFAFSVAVQADGGIVVAGLSYQATDGDFALARYDDTGTLDTGFDGDGLVTTDFGFSFDAAYSVAVQCDGRIVAAGESDGDFALARYDGGTVNQPPVAVCGQSPTAECTSAAGADVELDGSGSYDPDAGDVVLFHWDVSDLSVVLNDPESPTPTGTFPIGVTMATLTVADGRGGVDTCDVTVTVQDTVPPQVMVTTNIASLWPPNHAMRDVQVKVVATDTCQEPGEILPIVVTVRSDEPDDATGNGDGATTGDVNFQNGYSQAVVITTLLTYNADQGAWIGTIKVRAERAGSGDGRAYTIDAAALDSENNFTTTSCVVVVPHDRKPS